MSALHDHVEEYLALRRHLGFKLADAGRSLPRFADYLESEGLSTVTIEAALAFATRSPRALRSAGWANQMSIVRGFACYLAAIDPTTEVPPTDLLPHGRHRAVPYLYSDADVAALLDAARKLRQPLRAATYVSLLGLLSVTGMRLGEAIRLEREDVSWSSGLLVVRDTKFGKSRELPLAPSSLDALERYSVLRDGAVRLPISEAFFVSRAGRPLIATDIHQVFSRLRVEAGLAGRAGTPRPRIHDLRHSFAVRTLLEWHREGADVTARLPRLSTYLGHSCPESTYWYLSGAPELMAIAADRLEAAREQLI